MPPVADVNRSAKVARRVRSLAPVVSAGATDQCEQHDGGRQQSTKAPDVPHCPHRVIVPPRHTITSNRLRRCVKCGLGQPVRYLASMATNSFSNGAISTGVGE
jgi:hypothetical protein